MNNRIYLRRKNKLVLEPTLKQDGLSKTVLATMLKNVEALGYTFSKDIIKILQTYNEKTAISFYNTTITTLKEMVGAHKRYSPMYPNFPEQVMKMDEAELYLNALMHYLGDWLGYRIMPVYEKEKRPELKDKFKLKVIELGTLEDFELIFTQLLSAKTSISDTDKEDVKWFIESYKSKILNIVPETIPLKENVALFAGILLETLPKQAAEIITKYIKTATDVLRLATQLSGGDISLAENTKFKKFKRSERKLLLSLLENCNNHLDDMMKYKYRWIRLGEILHPGEYRLRFPNVYKSFDIIRNNKPYQTYNSKIEIAILYNKIAVAVDLLKSRPGVFARKLDSLLRSARNKDTVIVGFKEIAEKVSSNVLLQVMTHFQNRNKEHDMRVFFPKGNVSKVKAIDYDLPKIDEQTCKAIVKICKTKLIEKYKKLPELGKCFIDETLENYTVPFALRSASKALKTISRGSKIDIPKGDTLRFFIWWKNQIPTKLEKDDGYYYGSGDGRVDIDLSALLLDENYNEILTLAYYNLRDDAGYGYGNDGKIAKSIGVHSGDVTSSPTGASEFIDINIEAALARKVRYVVASITSFTGQPYKDLPECFAGIMIRQKPKSGEIYDPRTVENKFDLTGDTKMCVPMIIDLVDRKMIWIDISIKNNKGLANNVYRNMNSLSVMTKSMTSLVKPNLYDLFKLHVKARGIEVDNIKEAKTIFSINKGITPFSTEQIISEYI